jgi:hypothetical protein
METQGAKGADMSESVTIRTAVPNDREDIDRLAELDGGHAPAGDALLGFVDGRLVAAVGIDDDRTVADPFQYTIDLVRMLSLRAAQERPGKRGGLLTWLFLGHRLSRQGMAA